MKNSLFQSSVFPIHPYCVFATPHEKKGGNFFFLLMEGATPTPTLHLFFRLLHLFHTKEKRPSKPTLEPPTPLTEFNPAGQ